MGNIGCRSSFLCEICRSVKDNPDRMLGLVHSKFDMKTNQSILICNLKFNNDSQRLNNSLFKGFCIPLELFSILLHAKYFAMN